MPRCRFVAAQKHKTSGARSSLKPPIAPFIHIRICGERRSPLATRTRRRASIGEILPRRLSFSHEGFFECRGRIISKTMLMSLCGGQASSTRAPPGSYARNTNFRVSAYPNLGMIWVAKPGLDVSNRQAIAECLRP